jgi:ribosomal protein S18 acetylase RimI-like enzyme
LTVAAEADFPAVVALANQAYRDTSGQGWTTEAHYIAGQRLDAASLEADLEAQPQARLLIWREAGELLGAVWLEPAGNRSWYLGLLTVRPDLQGRGAGRRLLQSAEDAIRARGGDRVEMTVVNIRDSLIAWYERRGYRLTGERRPFPYGNERFGKPLRDDLEFVVMEKFI